MYFKFPKSNARSQKPFKTKKLCFLKNRTDRPVNQSS